MRRSEIHRILLEAVKRDRPDATNSPGPSAREILPRLREMLDTETYGLAITFLAEEGLRSVLTFHRIREAGGSVDAMISALRGEPLE